MTSAVFTLILFASSIGAGLLGSLTGLGGGIIITPILVLGFGVDIRYAVGASLIAVIATSSGAAAAFVREGFTNVRIAMLLEVATVIGAITGALIAAKTPPGGILLVFGVVLIYTAYSSITAKTSKPFDGPIDPLAQKLKLSGTYPTKDGTLEAYSPRRIPLGFALMYGAGVLSALIGIGSGVIKVLAMDRAMGLPFKVSTTTSNFMIGVTAAASAGVYLHRGQIDPILAAPVALGALVGAYLGAKILPGANVVTLRRIFAAVVVVVALQMIYKGVTSW